MNTVLSSRVLLAFSAALVAVSIGMPSNAQQAPASAVTRTFRFANGSDGMLPIYTDYNLGTADFRFLAEVRGLPPQISRDGRGRQSFFLQGNNRSDDLFMGLKAVLTSNDGIVPNQAYLLNFVVNFASNASACPGIGGSPGLSVVLKAGGSTLEPVPMLFPDHYVSINVDKGQQMNGGSNFGVVSNIDNARSCEEPGWALLQKSYLHPIPINASTSGDIWVTVGTESGYEGLTQLYYRTISVTLTPVRH